MPKWKAPDCGRVRLRDRYFQPRVAVNHTATLPYCLQRCEETGRAGAFRLQWRPGQPRQPQCYWDSDFAKVVEGLAYDQILHPDVARAAELEKIVDLILSAQQPDGYLNTYFTVVEPEHRWHCLLIDHELYCAGHLIEAAVAHHAATGQTRFLDAMARYADLIGKVFGRGPGQKRGYPGHPELELALCRLADATGQTRFAELAAYFVDERGREPNYFTEEIKRTGRSFFDLVYFQAHKPVREQDGAEGHAVRALYLLCGMADLAARGDDTLLDACQRQWRRITERQMYVTGGIGATSHGEAFTADYNLPNDSAYNESCAAIALALLAHRLLNLTGDGAIADTLERALYNGALAGLSLDGTRFFYANLPEVDDSTHVHNVTDKIRQPWYECSCCPTNFARFVPQLGQFTVSAAPDAAVIHIPAALDAELSGEGWSARLALRGDYPYDGRIRLDFSATHGVFALKIRIPGWCGGRFAVRVNGVAATTAVERGYVTLPARAWREGDAVEWDLELAPRRVRSHPLVAADAGKVSLARGPLVYALENLDNDGVAPASLAIPADSALEAVAGHDLPGGALPEGTVALRGRAWRDRDVSGGRLYYEDAPEREEMMFTAIPSALWQNRGRSAMRIWMRETP